jgi:hypothetical protein
MTMMAAVASRVNESGFEPLIMRHFLCLPFGNGIRMSIESGIDLTRRGIAARLVVLYADEIKGGHRINSAADF